MKNIIIRYIKQAAVCSVLLSLIASCKQDEYFDSGGKANPTFNGTMMQYLESKPAFDTIAQIIKLADMESAFKSETITFFAPSDEVIKRTIGTYTGGGLNRELFLLGKDTIKALSDVEPAIWRKYLSRYIFKGAYKLKDYPQLDYDLKQLYPGAFYYTYGNDVANIGVVFNIANNVKYTGYRQLSISFLPDASNPTNFIAAAVASSDMQPTNGVVHALALSIGEKIGAVYTNVGANTFGFTADFNREVILNK